MRALVLAALASLPVLAQLQVSVVNQGVATPVNGTIAIGTVAQNDPVQVGLQFANTGNTGIYITLYVASWTTPEAMQLGYEGPGCVAPGQFASVNLPVPTAAVGTLGGTLSITYVVGCPSGPIGPAGPPGTPVTVTVALNGAVAAAGGSGNPVTVSWMGTALSAGAAIVFPRLMFGQSETQTIVVTNPGAAAATVPVSVSGPGFALGAGVSSPLTVGAGASVSFAVVFTPAAANVETGTLSVAGRSFELTGNAYLPPFPAPVMSFAQATAASGQQNTLNIDIGQGYLVSETLQLAMTFTASTPDKGDDLAIQFLSGNPRQAAVTFAAGATHAQEAFQTGTTAGTITFTLTLPDGTTETQTLTIPAEQVQLDTATAVSQPGQIVVSLSGFDNTHAASQMVFTFFDASGNAIQPGAMTVDVSKVFGQYFASDQGAGGVFALRAVFPVNGTESEVAGVQATLSNPIGTVTTQTMKF
jgi:hypothetical protein